MLPLMCTGNQALFHRLVTELPPHQLVAHAPVGSAAEAAKARGVGEELGGKSLIMLTGRGDPVLCVLGASDSLDNRLVRRALGTSRLRFATPEELHALTGCVPGAVPPFGEPWMPIPTVLLDAELAARPTIWFTPGVLDHSIGLEMSVYRLAARPRVDSLVRKS